MWSENGNMYQRSLSGSLGFHCLCSFGSLTHLETQSFLCRICKSWCVLSSIPLASGNATQDSKAIVECKIRWLTATQNMCHFVSFFAWKVKLSYCNEDNKPKSRSISSSVALHWNLLLSPLISAAGASRCPMDGYLHLGIKGQNSCYQPQHPFLSEDEKPAVGISGGFQPQKHGHEPGMLCVILVCKTT